MVLKKPLASNLTLTVCIIANQVSPLLKNALDSVRGADKILLSLPKNALQAGEELAKNVPQLIVSKRSDGNITDFSKVRNTLLSQVKSGWILVLDSDEALLSQVVTVKTQLGRLPKHISHAEVTRTDVFAHRQLRFTEAGAQTLVRLWKAGACQYQGSVHEVPKCTGTSTKLPINITHFPHSSVDSFLEKIEHYAELRAQELPRNKPLLMFQLLIYPPAKYLYNLVALQGFRDGWRGVVYASVMSLHSLLARIRALQLYEHHT